MISTKTTSSASFLSSTESNSLPASYVSSSATSPILEYRSENGEKKNQFNNNQLFAYNSISNQTHSLEPLTSLYFTNGTIFKTRF